MGSLLCCLRGDDLEDHHGCCFHVRWVSRPIVDAYLLLFQRGNNRIAPSSQQETDSLASGSLIEDNSTMDTFRCPPRPLPFDDPRFSHGHHHCDDIPRPDKSSPHFQAVSVLRNKNDAFIEPTGMTKKSNGSSLKHESVVEGSRESDTSSSEEEDACPICLEEYLPENPRIILQCNHHFHLGCIYEWMERSEACPICGKVMLFNEETQ
ncbi:E3 ubiquitin-protein ligase At3g02290-like [Typha angustifolia]|uniref:E3 ubiquitin-protein ligase At3g02290-like n=1 Tax=Typha angustifolia TaxID=59011 RepID=UPI003C2FF666